MQPVGGLPYRSYFEKKNNEKPAAISNKNDSDPPFGITFPHPLRRSRRRTGSKKDGEVGDFVWNFVQQNGDGRQQSDAVRDEKRGADGHPVREVVDGVRRQIQIARDLSENGKRHHF